MCNWLFAPLSRDRADNTQAASTTRKPCRQHASRVGGPSNVVTRAPRLIARTDESIAPNKGAAAAWLVCAQNKAARHSLPQEKQKKRKQQHHAGDEKMGGTFRIPSPLPSRPAVQREHDADRRHAKGPCTAGERSRARCSSPGAFPRMEKAGSYSGIRKKWKPKTVWVRRRFSQADNTAAPFPAPPFLQWSMREKGSNCRT